MSEGKILELSHLSRKGRATLDKHGVKWQVLRDTLYAGLPAYKVETVACREFPCPECQQWGAARLWVMKKMDTHFKIK